tara:strand:- start:3695 stop:5239 length:1545 start_codon:yes stop_codon:yes gene_type:complete
MSEIKEVKPQGMMSKQTENEDTGFIARMIPDRNERRATGKLIGDALTSLSTMFGSTATQLGAMREEEEISDERQALAVQAAENRISVVGAENKKRANELEKILDRKKIAEDNANLLFSQPMFKTAIRKYTKETGNTPDLSEVKVNLGRRWAKIAALEGEKTATATIANEIYHAKNNPKVELFDQYKTPFTKTVKTTLDQQTNQALSQPKSVAENIVARKPENIPGQIAGQVTLDPKVRESKIPGTSKTFPVLDGSGAFRLERGLQNLIAANAGLVLSYPEGDRSTKAVLSAEGGTGKENDISFATQAMELGRAMLNSGYSETDVDILYRDLSLILQNATPKDKESITEQKDFEDRVNQIKLELSRIDNRFERRQKIEQLKKGEGLPEEIKSVVTKDSIVRSVLDIPSKDRIASYLNKGNKNINKVNDTTFNITVKNGTDNYPVGTVLSVEVVGEKVTKITNTGQKADVVPETYEEWKALPEETTEQKQAKRRFMSIEAVRKGIQEENRKKKDQQ